MKRAQLLVSGILWLGALSATMTTQLEEAVAQAPDKEYTIAIGETLTFSSRNIARVSLGLPEVANAKTTSDGRQILVTALKTGVTTINFYHNKKGQQTVLVRVVLVNPIALAQEVREILGDRSGVDVRVVKGRVVLEGEVASETHKKRIEKMTSLYPNQVLNFSTFRESFVEGAKMVAIELDFIQLATTTRDSLGFNWGQFLGANISFGTGDVPLYYQAGNGAGGGGGGELGSGVLPGERNPSRLPLAVPLTGGPGLTGYYSLVGNLNLALDFLQENGMIKTRQHGVIVTEAGKKAEYQSGGTLLIKTATDLVEKPYGMRMVALPIVDVDNRVKLDVELDISELDQANGVDGVPALRRSQFKSVVNMQEGQSVLIGGITSSQATSSEQGFWILGQIPFLGWLFKGRTYLEQGLDNALFITPKIYEPGSKLHDALVKAVFHNMIEAGLERKELPKLSNAPKSSRRSKKKSSKTITSFEK